MIIPEHREALIHHRNEELNRREKPTLEDSDKNRISELLNYSLGSEEEITVAIFDVYMTREITGAVKRIMPHEGHVLVAEEWIKIEDVTPRHPKPGIGMLGPP